MSGIIAMGAAASTHEQVRPSLYCTLVAFLRLLSRGQTFTTALPHLATIPLGGDQRPRTFSTVAFYTELISGMKCPELVPVASPGPAPGFFV